jgi:DGQHR domain-containing protein
MKTEIRLPAIEVKQGPGRTLYTFAVDGKIVHRFATISRVARAGTGELTGYQRPEVLSHIGDIRTYIESESPMIPNAVVLAFDSRVRFEPAKKGASSTYSRAGELVIPLDDDAPPEERPAFVVDGQQRLAAIRDAEVDSFPICASAFITDDVREQTEQFILVNSTKPLPKGLIYELLPGTEASLPPLLLKRRLPAYLLTRLNNDENSPLKGRIQTATNPGGIIKDNSILKMLENSLAEGLLYRLRVGLGAEWTELEPLLGVLHSFWRAVALVFDDAWGLPPKRSRLMHGAGVVSLGLLMDAIGDRLRSRGEITEAMFRKDLLPLKPLCRWVDGYWDFGPGQQRKWNEIQNTSKDMQLLANFLLVQYKALVWSQAPKGTGPQMQLGVP